VQLIEGRMAFPVRKQRQIGHLAFLLLWLRTRRSGVRVPPGAPCALLNQALTAIPKTGSDLIFGPFAPTTTSHAYLTGRTNADTPVSRPIIQSLRSFCAGQVPFVCSEADVLGEEQSTVYIKVERMVCLDRLDFEPGRNFCAAQGS
jgi:hypothetical protein